MLFFIIVIGFFFKFFFLNIFDWFDLICIRDFFEKYIYFIEILVDRKMEELIKKVVKEIV